MYPTLGPSHRSVFSPTRSPGLTNANVISPPLYSNSFWKLISMFQLPGEYHSRPWLVALEYCHPMAFRSPAPSITCSISSLQFRLPVTFAPNAMLENVLSGLMNHGVIVERVYTLTNEVLPGPKYLYWLVSNILYIPSHTNVQPSVAGKVVSIAWLPLWLK